MALPTVFTEQFLVEAPIVLAPMGGYAGGALAAAVSNGGGLGMLGAGRGDRDWLDRELALVADATEKPWGIGFLSWAVDVRTVESVVEHEPAALMFSFGDPTSFVEVARAADIPVLIQVTDLDEAKRALDLGADYLIAQGVEAGGHGGGNGWSTFPFVPTVVDLAGSTPVLAAGGIGDGRGLAAALVLGAVGALIGTRFQATTQALIPDRVRTALLEASGEDTESSRITDIMRGSAWPAKYPARTLRNEHLDDWRGREAELESDSAARRSYLAAKPQGPDPDSPVWAGQSVDLITDIPSATDLVKQLTADAERAVSRIRTS